MKLPYRKNAYIPAKKLSEYLLSETHGRGKHKAKLFQKVGYTKENADELKECLLKIAYTCDLKEIKENSYGKNYLVEGEIRTPAGQTVTLKTVWFIRIATKRPRLATAFPVVIK